MELLRDAELTAFVDEVATELKAPGVSVGVLAGGQAYAAPFGVTSVANPLPVDEDTLFLIGSTSKTFTATALMALVDRGTLSLADRVTDHLPDFRLHDDEVARTVTVGQLLNHTGGWRGDLPPSEGWGDDALAACLDVVAAQPQETPPGTLASYANSAFTVAGHLLATVHGTSFEGAVRELVLEPLGLSASAYFPWEIAHRRHAVGHIYQDDVPTAVPIYPVSRAIGPSGGLWSSVREQLAYASYHLDGTTDGTPPLKDETRLLMQQPTVTARAGISGVGVCWLLIQHGDVRLVTHGGNISNVQTSTFVMAPDHDLAVTVLTNAKHGAAIGAQVLAWALERHHGIGPRPALPTMPFDAGELVGVYDLGPFAHELTSDNGRLFVALKVPDDVSDEVRAAFTSPPRELVAIEPDLFALAADPVEPVLEVRRAPDGSVEGIVHGLRFARRVP